MTLGQRIKRERERAGLSQRQLADGLEKVTPAFVSRLEHDERGASFRTLVRIADRLGTTPLYLMTGRRRGVVCPCCRQRV